MNELYPNVLPIEEQAERALIDAVTKVIDENARLGLPIYVWRGGKLVDIGPEEAAKRSYPVKNGNSE